MSSWVEIKLKKFFVTVDNEEIQEVYFADAQCVFCEVKGAYRISWSGIAFCEKCLKNNYKHVREEEV